MLFPPFLQKARLGHLFQAAAIALDIPRGRLWLVGRALEVSIDT